MPFHEGPVPKEVVRFDAGSVSAFIYPAAGYRRGEFVIRVGRWKSGGKQFYSSEFIPMADIDDLLAVVAMAKDALAEAPRTRAQRR